MMSDMHYDAVIVGSGFGGSVMAYRLAEAGLNVCLLERGKAYPPGSFPRAPHKMKDNFWNPSQGLYGMFDLWAFQGFDGVVSSGLGGGSLIYANVILRKDERWFVKEDLRHGGYEYWPVTREMLDPHYDRVEQMLKVQRYPLEHAPYNQTPKTLALKTAAQQLNLDWFQPNLAVTFANPGAAPMTGEPIIEEYPNLHGRTRQTCRLCGECDIGCNYGSKNTLDYTYLSAAKRLGAEIKTGCEVRSFEPRNGGGYTIHYVEHDFPSEGQPQNTAPIPQTTITADRLILSAGTFGSSFLLLKNRSAFPHISTQLGTRFSGNGDYLSFAFKCKESTDGHVAPRILDGSYGPVITSAIRIPDALDGGTGRGFYIQDAGYPDFVNWMLQLYDMPSLMEDAEYAVRRIVGDLLHQATNPSIGADISRLFGSCNISAGVLPLLGMGRDIPNGNMKLRNGLLDIDWHTTKSNEYFQHMHQVMRELTSELGGTFVDDPLWYLKRTITVHPLGGCPMGRDASEGVVDSFGQVFNYPGLYIADGSVMPGPTGANPSLTIAALSDRFADHIIETRAG